MRTIAKILLVPIWLILFLLKWACNIVRGLASVLLCFAGSILLVVGVIFLCMGDTSRQPAMQALIVGGGCFLLPFVLALIGGIVEAGQTLIGEFITDT